MDKLLFWEVPQESLLIVFSFKGQNKVQYS